MSGREKDFDWGALGVFEHLGRERVAELQEEITRKTVEGFAALDAVFKKHRHLR
jgi:hypothetical protein